MRQMSAIGMIALAGMIYAGCSDSSGSSGPTSSGGTANNAAPVISSVSAGASKSQPSFPANASFTISAVVSDSDNDQLTYSWKQVKGPQASSLGATNAVTLTGTTPSVAKAEEMLFELTVADGKGGLATAQAEVPVDPAPQTTYEHQLKFSVVDDPDSTAGDYLEAELVRKDGTPVDSNKRVELVYTLTVAGKTYTRSIGVFGPNFKPAIGLGKDVDGNEIFVKDLEKVEVKISEGGTVIHEAVALPIPDPTFPGAKASKTVDTQ